jgi:hypothetical protein
MTDFDLIARIRRLEAQVEDLKHRIAESERQHRRYHDAPEYKREHAAISDEEAYGAMVYTMNRQGK